MVRLVQIESGSTGPFSNRTTSWTSSIWTQSFWSVFWNPGLHGLVSKSEFKHRLRWHFRKNTFSTDIIRLFDKSNMFRKSGNTKLSIWFLIWQKLKYKCVKFANCKKSRSKIFQWILSFLYNDTNSNPPIPMVESGVVSLIPESSKVNSRKWENNNSRRQIHKSEMLAGCRQRSVWFKWNTWKPSIENFIKSSLFAATNSRTNHLGKGAHWYINIL